MSNLVRFNISAAFVNERVRLSPDELVYGYHHGWLSDSDVVAVALANLNLGGPLPSAEEDLALLLSDDYDRIPEIINDLSRSSSGGGNPAAVWLFLALAWLHEHRSDYLEPLEVIEMLYADFDYPDEMAGLVRFMPAPPGAATGYRAIEQRWEDYLDRKGLEFRTRNKPRQSNGTG
jgi:hypothetical protein